MPSFKFIATVGAIAIVFIELWNFAKTKLLRNA